MTDATSSKPGEESYVDTAKKAVGDAVEYVEKTATGIYSLFLAHTCSNCDTVFEIDIS